MTEILAGSDANFAYGWETSENTKSTVINKSFGVDSIVTFDESNDIETIYGDGSKTPTEIQSKAFIASSMASFKLASPWIFTSVLGVPVKSVAGNTLNNYTWDSNLVSSNLPNMSIAQTIGNSSKIAIGSAAKKLNISFSDGSHIDCESEFDVYKTIVDGKKSPVTDPEDAYLFSHATLEVPSGTSILGFKSMDLAVDWGERRKISSGTKYKNMLSTKTLKISGSFDAFIHDTSQFNSKFLNGSKTTAKILFANGKSGSSQRKIEMILEGMKPSTYGASNLRPDEDIIEKIGFEAKRIKVIALSNEASAK